MRSVKWGPSSGVVSSFLGGLAVLVALSVVGCGEKVEMKPHDNTGGVSQTDQDKIRKFLDDAGVKGEIYTFADDGTQWVVEVGAPKPPPGKRAAPSMPVPYTINKETGKVTGG